MTKWLQQMSAALSIRRKLVLSFAGGTLLLVMMTGVGVWRLHELDQAARQMASDLHMQRLVGDWLAHTRSNAVRATVLAQSGDAGIQDLLRPEMEATSKRINGLQKQVEASLDTDIARQLYVQMADTRKDYLAARKQVLETRKTDEQAAREILSGVMLPAVRTYVGSIQALADYYDSRVEADSTEARAAARSGRWMLVLFCLAGVGGAALFSWLTLVSILRPIEQAIGAARQVARGDLTARVPQGERHEMGQMLAALAEMARSLRSLVTEVAQGARHVSDTSAQIAHGNRDLSQRTESQASTLEETASSMEELTSTVAQNAGTARQASQLAAQATQSARKAGQAVSGFVGSMAGISQASSRVEEITSVMDSIAFQTNILALNAAVEAARAGEQGRGFAVVAAEVRRLAQQSGAAAKEIKSLIAESARQVDAGTRMVGEAGRTMDEVVAAVEHVAALIAEIAAASQEQSQGIEQVNTAVAHMEQVVQQNASLAEEATAATEALNQQSQHLLQLVSRFQVGQADAAASLEPAAVRPRAVAPELPVPPARLAPALR